MLTLKQEMRALVDELNYHTKLYDMGKPIISDQAWDDMYFKLQKMEKELNGYYEDSPTRVINYQVLNKLNKVEHNHKMLSLDKTKSLDDVKNFCKDQTVISMAKIDGLTCSLRYLNGKLISAETRGNGIIGEDVLHNALTIPTIPHRIDYNKELIVDGEIVCLYKHFENFKEEYKNPRNFASGSIRLLDSKECSKRHLTFIAWDVIKGFEDSCYTVSEKLYNLESLGFFIVPFWLDDSSTINENNIQVLINNIEKKSIPIDGLVFKFNDISYGKVQGETSHHFKNAIAYKFYDEEYETELLDIEWSMGRSGVLTPIAIFKAVDDGESITERASLHNLSIMKEILGNPYKGQKIWISKMNMIIPQVVRADKESTQKEEDTLYPPELCPICGLLLTIYRNNDSTFLMCENNDCEGKFINHLKHYCSKKGLDIKGLSSATLEKLIDWGWINNLLDLYSLNKHKEEWIQKSGFGPKSVDNILQAIEDSKECSLDSFISALGIPLIGKNVSAELVKYFTTYEAFRKAIMDNYDFSELEGFADSKTSALLNFDYTEADKIAELLHIKEIKKIQENNLPLNGKKYVVTGTIKQFKNRTELQQFIEEHGGKVVSSISKNVNFLINNNINSTSAKNIAAKKMGIPIITEAEFLEELN